MLRPNPTSEADFYESCDKIEEAHRRNVPIESVLPDPQLPPPPATLYSDTDNAHHNAATALVERAKKQGIYSVNTGPQHHAVASDEQLNPHLALPAAYILASRIYDRMNTISSTDTAAALPPKGPDEIKKMSKRLYELINLGAMDLPVDEKGRIIPLADAESLQYAVSVKQDDIVAGYEGNSFGHPDEDDLEVLLESLGQLCVEQLGRNQSAPAPKTKGVAHQGRIEHRSNQLGA